MGEIIPEYIVEMYGSVIAEEPCEQMAVEYARDMQAAFGAVPEGCTVITRREVGQFNGKLLGGVVGGHGEELRTVYAVAGASGFEQT